MTKEEKKHYVLLSRRRYGELTGKKEKGAFLDQFCAVTGVNRKNAIRRLSPKERPHRRRGRPFKADVAARDLLARIWKLADRPCGKLLRPVLGVWIDCLRKEGEDIPGETAAAVLGMSASTIDRRLRGSKPRVGGGRRASSLSEHRREVPLKVDVWPRDATSRAGWVEVDTVAHCGGSMAGSFCWTLTLADVATQWVEMRCTWNNGAEAVVGRLGEMAEALPFAVAGVNSDNGPEFLNWHLRRNFRRLFPKAVRSRSRPYRKNDNAHVEQKNGSVVRELFGELRLDCQDLEPDLMRLEAEWSDYCNFFRPTKMIVSKTKKADGKGYVRKYQDGGPRTPYQRVLESGVLTEAEAEALTERYRRLNGIQLYQQAVRRLKRILRRQEAWRDRQRDMQRLLLDARLAASALRAAPSGTSAPPGIQDGGIDLRPSRLSSRRRKLQGVQYLTNKKTTISYRVHFLLDEPGLSLPIIH